MYYIGFMAEAEAEAEAEVIFCRVPNSGVGVFWAPGVANKQRKLSA